MSRAKILTIIFFISSAIFYFWNNPANASTNISATTTAHWAWNDVIGWVDFYNTQTVTVSSTILQGYASSSAGDISLDCHTTSHSPPDICGTSQYQITNDRAGNLSGWGWNDEYGWISFDCNNNGGCGTSNYRVYINGATGDFENYAWNDAIGWISFNCNNYTGGCTKSTYKVNTSWLATSTTGTLDSSTFDTGVNAGAQLNSVMWHGSQPVGTSVWFQFAVSTSSSPASWNFVGTDGTSDTYYATGPDASLKLNYSLHNNFRYFRYKVGLISNTASTVSPRVDEVIVNWSP
jgi:hypothetical protein